MYKKISILILLLAITSCKNGDSDKRKEKLKWRTALGTWENKSADGYYLKFGQNK
jgi:hypothetical protein